MIWLLIFGVALLFLFVASGIDDTRNAHQQNAKSPEGPKVKTTPVCPRCGRVYPCICPGRA